MSDKWDNLETIGPAAPEASLGNMVTGRQGDGESLGRVDRYVLLDKLGQGGFGAVYRAHDEVAGIDVALKALPPLVVHNPEELERVRDNFQIVNKLTHANIAAVHHLHAVEQVSPDCELRLDKGDYLVVMECVSGTTLSRYVRQYEDRKMPLADALTFTAGIAEALDFAHSRSVIHRDVKPANVMLTDDKEVKVLDFGLAAEIRSSMTRVSQEIVDTSGTRPYMAPEQWSGSRQGAATDQYALAVLFHELVAGAVPFEGAFNTGDATVMLSVVKNEMPPPIPELAKKQNLALAKALAKDPADRFASCGDFIGALRGRRVRSKMGASAAVPVPAKPRSARRVVGVVLLMLVAAGAIGYRVFQRTASPRFSPIPPRRPAAPSSSPGGVTSAPRSTPAPTVPQLSLKELVAQPTAQVKMLIIGWEALAESPDENAGKWVRIPEEFKGAMIASKSANKHIGVANLEITESGRVFLACDYSYQGNSSGDWTEERWTQQDFITNGWELISGVQLIDWGGRSFVVFTKNCNAGDTYRLRCNKYEPPYVILPKQAVETNADR